METANQESEIKVEEQVKAVDKRLKTIEATSSLMTGKVTDTVLDKVGEMLSDNIYDIIPGYAELEENFQNFTGQYDDMVADVKEIKMQLEEMIDNNG